MQRVLAAVPSRTHSKRFLKRRFGLQHGFHAKMRNPVFQREPEPIPAPVFAASPVEVSTPSGWSAPQPQLTPTGLPFKVYRVSDDFVFTSVSQRSFPLQVERAGPGKQIPVYRDYLAGRTKAVTIVRRVQGDTAALAAELRRITNGAHVRVRAGKLEVEGDRKEQISIWLQGLGM